MCELFERLRSVRCAPNPWRCPAALMCFAFLPLSAQAQDNEEGVLSSMAWQQGPGVGALGDIAEIAIPDGHVFVGAADTTRLMEFMQNPTDGSELGFIAPADLSWFVVFEFSDVGYVKDDERDGLDADAMLESIRAGTENSNKERRKRGWPTLEIVGWEQPPRYDPATNNLVWAIRGKSADGYNVNYNTRRLGRKGVMSIALVLDPEQLPEALPKFESLMGGYAFVPGQKYAEFRAGDKIAKYGLTALVTGGAVAIAAKSGLLKWLWKGIVVAVLAVGAAIKGVFGRRKASTS